MVVVVVGMILSLESVLKADSRRTFLHNDGYADLRCSWTCPFAFALAWHRNLDGLVGFSKHRDFSNAVISDALHHFALSLLRLSSNLSVILGLHVIHDMPQIRHGQVVDLTRIFLKSTRNNVSFLMLDELRADLGEGFVWRADRDAIPIEVPEEEDAPSLAQLED